MLGDRLTAGEPRSTLLYLNFEDERLTGLTGAELSQVTELYYRLHPEWRDQRRVLFLLDEIQVIPGWETYVRRLLDSEQVDLRLSGSSAKLLSREVATSMRGRALEVLVHPFSFREVLRHAGVEPKRPWAALPKAARSVVEKGLADYLLGGGFPEAQGLGPRDQAALLRSYVDVALLRDVVERHAVSNPRLFAGCLGTCSVRRPHPLARKSFMMRFDRKASRWRKIRFMLTSRILKMPFWCARYRSMRLRNASGW